MINFIKIFISGVLFILLMTLIAFSAARNWNQLATILVTVELLTILLLSISLLIIKNKKT